MSVMYAEKLIPTYDESADALQQLQLDVFETSGFDAIEAAPPADELDRVAAKLATAALPAHVWIEVGIRGVESKTLLPLGRDNIDISYRHSA